MGLARRVRRRQRDRDRERARGLPRGGRAALRPLRHRGRAARRRAAAPGRRDRPLRPDSKALYRVDQGAGRAGRPRGRRRTGSSRRRAAATASGARATRPCCPEIVAAVEAGRFAWIGGGGHLTDTTHVDNVVEGLLLGRGARAGPARPTSSPTASRWSSASSSRSCSRRRGSSRRPGRCPAGWRAALAAGSEAAWRLLRLGGEPPLTRLALWLSSQECTIEISKARAELGYEPVTTPGRGPRRAPRRVGLDHLAAPGALELGREQLRVQGADQRRERRGAALDDVRGAVGASAEKRSTSSSSSSAITGSSPCISRATSRAPNPVVSFQPAARKRDDRLDDPHVGLRVAVLVRAQHPELGEAVERALGDLEALAAPRPPGSARPRGPARGRPGRRPVRRARAGARGRRRPQSSSSRITRSGMNRSSWSCLISRIRSANSGG